MTASMMPIVETMKSIRRSRRPVHPFTVKHQPWQIWPFFIAPVLPGETMTNLLMQARAVTDPIKHPLIGWWLEYYFFYVKLRDLYERADLTNMVLDPAWSPTPVTTAQGGTSADTSSYYAGGAGQIDYVELCRRRVVDEYFRDEGESYSTRMIAGTGGVSVPAAQISLSNNVWDSAREKQDYVALDVDVDTADANTTVQASEVELAMRTWEALKLNNLSNISFEDMLALYGIKSPAVELHRPELVRYVREWQYPSNTIDPTNGTPRSAVSWSVAERADKRRLFKEQGFLVGYTVARPKVYLSRQTGSFTSQLNNMFAWLPPSLTAEAGSRIQSFADGVGPFPAGTDVTGYIIDMADLFLYGEQFVAGVSLAATDNNLVALPAVDLSNKRYAAGADIDGLFVTPASANFVKQDGVVHLNIMSQINELSPRGGPVDAA